MEHDVSYLVKFASTMLETFTHLACGTNNGTDIRVDGRDRDHAPGWPTTAATATATSAPNAATMKQQAVTKSQLGYRIAASRIMDCVQRRGHAIKQMNERADSENGCTVKK